MEMSTLKLLSNVYSQGCPPVFYTTGICRTNENAGVNRFLYHFIENTDNYSCKSQKAFNRVEI
jgi:hypothetical protein